MSARRPNDSNRSSLIWVLVLTIAIAAALFYWWQQGTGGLAGLPGLAGLSGGTAPGASQGGAGGPGGTPVDGRAAGATAAAGQPGGASSQTDAAADSTVSAQGAAPGVGDEATRRVGPKHPLPPGVATADDPSLPDRAKSDGPILESLTGIAPRAELGRFGNLGDFTRRVVITIDNLPRERVPAQYSIVQRIPGPLAVVRDGQGFELSADNYRRYDPFVGFAVSVGAQRLASVYLRFYPLFQQEYRSIGFPDGHFHDRVIEAIDDMLAAPTLEGPIRLRQPKVHYVFEDPDLERLSAGRKILIRVGPDNAAKLKGLLRALRAELTAGS